MKTSGNGCDFLYLSSTDLHSWTSIDLPYRHMSLTIHKSKFVLIGGRDLSIDEPTNQLLTSITGEQWEPSLPPMPTKRSVTSSVSTRSPEVLVVAGGLGSKCEDLEVVEVLLEDKWVAVDSLPIPASWMRSTLHDGKLCFMKHGRKGSTVFTCSCTSLISSNSKTSGNSSTDRPLWQQFQAPDRWGGTVVSWSSRLAFIDEWGRVRGYSSIAQSWLTASPTGPTPNEVYIAATVLNTGELILAHKSGGVYRGTVSGERQNIEVCVCVLCVLCVFAVV